MHNGAFCVWMCHRGEGLVDRQIKIFSMTPNTCTCLNIKLTFTFRYPTEVTSTRLVIVFVSIWTFCFLVAGLPLCGWGQYRFQPQTVPICNPVWVTQVGFAIFLMVCGLMLPFAAMLYSYVRIVQIAKEHIAKIEATKACFVERTPPTTTPVVTHLSPHGGLSHGRSNNNTEKVVDVISEAEEVNAEGYSNFRQDHNKGSSRTFSSFSEHKDEEGRDVVSTGKHPRLTSKKNFSKTVRIANRVFTAVGKYKM